MPKAWEVCFEMQNHRWKKNEHLQKMIQSTRFAHAQRLKMA